MWDFLALMGQLALFGGAVAGLAMLLHPHEEDKPFVKSDDDKDDGPAY